MKIDGTTICITGGNKGVGAEIVKLLIPRVYKIYIIDRSEQIFYDDKIIYIKMDLGFEKPKNLPVFDIVISNLGKNIGQKTIKNTTDDDWEQMIEINIKTHIWLYKNTRFTKFVFISSVLSFVGFEQYSLYCASKAFLRIFNESLQNEGCNTLIVYPYKIDTKMFSEIRDIFTLKASYVADKIVQAIEKDHKDLYLPYIFKPLLILMTLLPNFIVRYIFKVVVKLLYTSEKHKTD